MKTTQAKRGRKTKPHKTRDGKTIDGLYHCPDGRWRITATGQKFTEPDERLAVAKFLRMTGSSRLTTITAPIAQAMPAVKLPATVPSTPELVADAVIKAASATRDIPGTAKADFRKPPAEWTMELEAHGPMLWHYVREQIIQNPKLIAELTGIEQIGYLTNLTKPTPSATLNEVGELYFSKSGISPKWLAKSKTFWNEFIDSVGVLTLRELTQENVAGYKADTLTNFGPVPTKQRFGQVKTIIAYSRKWGKWAEDRTRALSYTTILTPPKTATLDPHPIDPKDFKKLYDAANVQMRTILLLALNACMYAAEVADIRWEDIKLDAGVLVVDRNKTKVARVSVLWPETIAALRALPRKTDRLFITEATKQPHNSNTISKYFRDLRTDAKVSDEVVFSDIRDGAYTTSCEAKGVQYEHARALAGHRSGMSDHYVKRRPQIVADACYAIHARYIATANGNLGDGTSSG